MIKKGRLLNSQIISTIARMGHTDTLCIADAGLPIPSTTCRIDLAISKNFPDFIATLQVILEELCVEHAFLAKEIKENNPTMLNQIITLLKQNNITSSFISHEDLKTMTKDSKAVVRTGECSPYSNIILQSGVEF